MFETDATALAPRDRFIQTNEVDGTASATDTSDTAIIAAQGAGLRIYVTSLIIANTSATNTLVNIKSGSTTRLVFPAPSNGGSVHTLPTPLRLALNAALNFSSGASVTTMYVSAVGYSGA